MQVGVEVVSGVAAMGAGGGEALMTAPACSTGAGCAVPAVGVAVLAVGAVVTTHGTLVGLNTLNNIFMSKGGKQNKRDSGLENKTKEEISQGARDKSLTAAERKRYQTEEKSRGDRIKKRGSQ